MQVEETCGNYQTITCSGINQISKPVNIDKIAKDSDEINPDLEDKLHQIARREGFIAYKIHAKNIIPDGNNLLGVLSEVTIKGTTPNGNKKLDIFVKSTISEKENVKVMELDKLYDNEVYMYLELSKIFNQLQDEAKIPRKDRYNFVKCYKESNNDFIIMQNMRKRGFGLFERYDVISLEFAEKSIEHLARFHALSFVLQDRHPNYFNRHIKMLKFPVELNGEWKEFMTKNCNSWIEHLEEHTQERFKNLIPSVNEKLEEFYFPEPGSVMCLCHGDFKPNNILMRQKNGEIQLVPVDYQMLHYGSPITDFCFFMFTATDREFRRKHLDYLKSLYYNTMEKFLKNFDLHIEEYYPKEKYEKLIREQLIGGLIICTWILPVVLAESENNITDIGKSSLSEDEFVKNRRVKERFQGVVDDFIEWGYL